MTIVVNAEQVSELLAKVNDVIFRLERIQIQLSQVSIYRPVQAFRKIKSMSDERDKLKNDVNACISALAITVMSTPAATMGQTLSSCLDTIRLSAEMTRLQTRWIEVDSSAQQTGAFAFAIFALYISIVSLCVTIFLGVLPFVK